MKFFISYSTLNKDWGGYIKSFLDRCDMSSFLAHNDLQVSEEWKERILKELRSSDVFIPLLSKEFKASEWCSQEIGIAYYKRGMPIVPISLDDTTCYGFISNLQSKKIKNPNEIEDFIAGGLLRRNVKKGIELSIKLTENAGSFRHAESALERLSHYYKKMSADQSEKFAHHCIENGQVWAASECRENYLPMFLKSNQSKISSKNFKALTYQVQNQKWYNK